MATKEGYYGSDDTSNTFKGNGTNWFTLVNKKEGDITCRHSSTICMTNKCVIFVIT
mgnify:CR=1 FL=1